MTIVVCLLALSIECLSLHGCLICKLNLLPYQGIEHKSCISSPIYDKNQEEVNVEQPGGTGVNQQNMLRSFEKLSKGDT